MDKKIMIVAGIAVVVVIAAAAFLLVGGDEEKESYDDVQIGEIGTFVPIFGNANGDLYIDQKDVDMLQSIVDGNSVYDKKKAPYADANVDGDITQEDVKLVQNIINVKPCDVYYEDYFGEVTEVSFPLSHKKIAVTYYQQAEACAVLGVLEDITVASKAATVYGTMWPSLQNAVEWGTTGSSSITDDAVEKFIDNDVEVVVCTPRIENKELAQRLHEDRGIDFIQLWYNGNYCVSTIQTMGILMDCQEKSQKYMDFCNGIADELTSKITNKDARKVLVCSGYNPETDKLTVMANERHGSYALIDKYLADCYHEVGENQFGFVYKNVEWAITHNKDFDTMVVCPSGSGFSDDQKTGTYYTHDFYNTDFEKKSAYFERTDAYKDGNIIGTSYANIFGFSAYPIIKIIAAQMYPELFDIEDAYKTLQQWFDEYNVVDIDVLKSGNTSYTGDGFHTSYEQIPA